MKPVTAFPPYLFKIHFNIILPPMTSSSKWSCPFMFPHKNPTCISSLPHVPHFLPVLAHTPGVGELRKTSDSHLSLSLLVSWMSVQLKYKFFIVLISHVTHAVVFQLRHRKVNIEDSGLLVSDGVMTYQAVQETFLHSWIPEDESFEMSWTIHTATQCHIPEDLNFQKKCCENLKSQD